MDKNIEDETHNPNKYFAISPKSVEILAEDAVRSRNRIEKLEVDMDILKAQIEALQRHKK
jgi:hypothetical protein